MQISTSETAPVVPSVWPASAMEPASAKVAKQPRREQAPGGSDRTDATRATKKRKQADSPEGILRRAITDAIVSRSAQAGWDAFQARGDVGLQTDQLAQLLFLFTGAPLPERRQLLLT